jgi:hypothetical protein
MACFEGCQECFRKEGCMLPFDFRYLCDGPFMDCEHWFWMGYK